MAGKASSAKTLSSRIEAALTAAALAEEGEGEAARAMGAKQGDAADVRPPRAAGSAGRSPRGLARARARG